MPAGSVPASNGRLRLHVRLVGVALLLLDALCGEVLTRGLTHLLDEFLVVVRVHFQEVAGGGRFVPSRGTVPGGRFLSSFLVEPDSSDGAGAASANR